MGPIDLEGSSDYKVIIVAVSPYLNGSSSLNVATTPDARRTPLPTFA